MISYCLSICSCLAAGMLRTIQYITCRVLSQKLYFACDVSGEATGVQYGTILDAPGWFPSGGDPEGLVNIWLLSDASELRGMFALANKILLGKQHLTKSHVTSLKALPDGVAESY